jgi:hypothetical protein
MIFFFGWVLSLVLQYTNNQSEVNIGQKDYNDLFIPTIVLKYIAQVTSR